MRRNGVGGEGEKRRIDEEEGMRGRKWEEGVRKVREKNRCRGGEEERSRGGGEVRRRGEEG